MCPKNSHRTRGKNSHSVGLPCTSRRASSSISSGAVASSISSGACASSSSSGAGAAGPSGASSASSASSTSRDATGYGGGETLGLAAGGGGARASGRFELPRGHRTPCCIRECSGGTDRAFGGPAGAAWWRGSIVWAPGSPDRAIAALASARETGTRQQRPARGRDDVVAAGRGRPDDRGATAVLFGPRSAGFGPRGLFGAPFGLPESSEEPSWGARAAASLRSYSAGRAGPLGGAGR